MHVSDAQPSVLPHIHTGKELEALLSSPSGVRGTLLVFEASWCQPCAPLRQYIECTVRPRYASTLQIVYVDVEDLTAQTEICAALAVETVPHITFFRRRPAPIATVPPTNITPPPTPQGRAADVKGAKLSEVELNLRSLFGRSKQEHAERSQFTALDEYLRYLISRDTIVAFITGTPSRPCGVTPRLCALLKEVKAPYTYFDVLADDEVCEGLKLFSKWPTYPQVFAEGKLIGGMDSCSALHAEGTLIKALKVPPPKAEKVWKLGEEDI